MTERDAPSGEPAGGTTPRAVGSAQFERYLVVIVGVAGALYVEQSMGGVLSAARSMPGAIGAVSIAALIASPVVGLLPISLPRAARPLLLAAVALYAAAAVLWAVDVQGLVPVSPTPVFADVWPAEALYLVAAVRRPLLPVLPSIATLVATGSVTSVLAVHGLGPAELAVAVAPMPSVPTVLFILVCAIRWRIARSEAEHEVASREFGRVRADDAAEAERVRTDALIHDSVLTTLLAAAAARTPEDADLADRMAANALRVLAHADHAGRLGPGVPLSSSLQRRSAELDGLQSRFTMRLERAPDIVLPETVAEVVVAATVAVLRDAARRSGEGEGVVELDPLGPDGVRVVVEDAATITDAGVRAGLEADVIRPMRRIDGRADVRQHDGLRVVLSWGSVVISGTAPLGKADRAVRV